MLLIVGLNGKLSATCNLLINNEITFRVVLLFTSNMSI